MRYPVMRGIGAGEMDAAHEEWGANCGPSSIAAVCNLSLKDVRGHMGDFETKRYTNPKLMWSVLRSNGVRFHYRGGHLGHDNWPDFGLARIQWEGPWSRDGVPMKARYRHTHWIGVNAMNRNGIGIFDCNATVNGTGWTSLEFWKSMLVPEILDTCEPMANGNWHITHAVEVRQVTS